MQKILVTDTLFIHDKHTKELKTQGYEVERLEKTTASEDELKTALQGKVGYILGGLEKVTEEVLKSTDELKVISFTGTGWKGYIPGWEYATEKGIAISNAPSANAAEVAEWATAVMMAMQRDLFELGPKGDKSFVTVKSLMQLEVGIVGLGNIGREFAERAKGLKAKKVSYWSRQKKTDDFDYYENVDDLLRSADVIFLALGDDAGQDFISAERIGLIKKDALIVSILHKGIFNEDALYQRVSSTEIRAAFDIVADIERFRPLPSRNWYASNGVSGYNAESTFQKASDMATQSIINLLETGEDQYRVN
jgi:D-3-phosphoglycerate dehydrogenase